MVIRILNYGGIVTGIEFVNKNNAKVDILLGENCLSNYVSSKANFGNIIGRFFGRLKDGVLKLEVK